MSTYIIMTYEHDSWDASSEFKGLTTDKEKAIAKADELGLQHPSINFQVLHITEELSDEFEIVYEVNS